MHYNEIYTEGDYFYFNKNKLNLKFISKYYSQEYNMKQMI